MVKSTTSSALQYTHIWVTSFAELCPLGSLAKRIPTSEYVLISCLLTFHEIFRQHPILYTITFVCLTNVRRHLRVTPKEECLTRMRRRYLKVNPKDVCLEKMSRRHLRVTPKDVFLKKDEKKTSKSYS